MDDDEEDPDILADDGSGTGKACRFVGAAAEVLLLIVMRGLLFRFGMSFAPRLVAHFRLRTDHNQRQQ